MKFIYLILLAAFISCNNPKQEVITEATKTENTQTNDEVFLGKVVIILSEDLKEEGNVLNIQDYLENGKPFIPVFSSVDAFNESTQGKVPNETIEIDGMFLLSILNGTETLKLNPALQDETVFHSGALKEKYAQQIKKINAEMEAKKD